MKNLKSFLYFSVTLSKRLCSRNLFKIEKQGLNQVRFRSLLLVQFFTSSSSYYSFVQSGYKFLLNWINSFQNSGHLIFLIHTVAGKIVRLFLKRTIRNIDLSLEHV